MGLAVFVIVLFPILLAPAAVGRTLKDAYHDLPQEIQQAVPDSVERTLSKQIDASVRFFAFGNPDVLIQSDLQLTSATPAPHSWFPNRTLTLRWTNLGHEAIEYEVRYGPAGGSYSTATLVGSFPSPVAPVTVPADGTWTVYVRPRTEQAGHVSAFGPFYVDATAPPAPQLVPREDPPGYRFRLNWSGVDDLSGIPGYDVERRLEQVDNPSTGFEVVARASTVSHLEDQVGNGKYSYRIRAVNGAGLRGPPSNTIQIIVNAPMENPGAGLRDYGIHVNYTSFIHLWDLKNTDQYISIDAVPAAIRTAYLGGGYGIEVENATLRALVQNVVGSERNTEKIAEKLFVYLFDHTDYDSEKLAAGGNLPLQRAGETLDFGKGICGDLATLYLTLLRIAQVPARPVHGYLDNSRSGVGGFHMWVEVYVGPTSSSRPWMTVDVSGVTGSYDADLLYPYFGIFNPDYLALGVEQDYGGDDWNTWAQFQYVKLQSAPKPEIEDRTVVTELESEFGRLYFNPSTRQSEYVACPCSNGDAPPGMTKYYEVKGVSKKRIDYGADVSGAMPQCLTIQLRYPMTDEYGALNPDQSAIYRIYENSSSPNARIGQPEAAGWVTFTDGTEPPSECTGAD